MEGPHIRVLADDLHGALSGAPVERIDVPENRWQANMLLMNCVGQVVQQVRSHGKWIFIDFSHGISWACHLLAQSTWRITEPRPDQADRFVRGDARPPLIRATMRNGRELALTGRPLFLTLPTSSMMTHPQLAELGPDPLSPDFQPELFLTRLRTAANRALAAALTDQHILAGVGNQMKCEILFAAHVAPSVRVADLYATQMSGLVEPIRATMWSAYQFLKNDGAGTNPPYAVYDRAGEACHVCGTEIVADRNAGDGHWSWYCPQCQKAPAKPTLFE